MYGYNNSMYMTGGKEQTNWFLIVAVIGVLALAVLGGIAFFKPELLSGGSSNGTGGEPFAPFIPPTKNYKEDEEYRKWWRGQATRCG